jgi:hypothetical protein
VSTLIDPLYPQGTSEDLDGIHEIRAVLDKIRLTLRFIPLHHHIATIRDIRTPLKAV